jgi:hypothetical protein
MPSCTTMRRSMMKGDVEGKTLGDVSGEIMRAQLFARVGMFFDGQPVFHHHSTGRRRRQSNGSAVRVCVQLRYGWSTILSSTGDDSCAAD